MAVPYPSNPNTGTIFTHRGVSYIYDGDSWSTYTGNPNYALNVNPDTHDISIGPKISSSEVVASIGSVTRHYIAGSGTNTVVETPETILYESSSYEYAISSTSEIWNVELDASRGVGYFSFYMKFTAKTVDIDPALASEWQDFTQDFIDDLTNLPTYKGFLSLARTESADGTGLSSTIIMRSTGEPVIWERDSDEDPLRASIEFEIVSIDSTNDDGLVLGSTATLDFLRNDFMRERTDLAIFYDVIEMQLDSERVVGDFEASLVFSTDGENWSSTAGYLTEGNKIQIPVEETKTCISTSRVFQYSRMDLGTGSIYLTGGDPGSSAVDQINNLIYLVNGLLDPGDTFYLQNMFSDETYTTDGEPLSFVFSSIARVDGMYDVQIFYSDYGANSSATLPTSDTAVFYLYIKDQDPETIAEGETVYTRINPTISSVSVSGQKNDFVVFNTDTNGGASLNVDVINATLINSPSLPTITISSSLPTGGSDGDIWMVYS